MKEKREYSMDKKDLPLNKKILRRIGVMVLGAGILLMIIGMINFFTAFVTLEEPTLFWMFFVSMPLLFIGVTCLGLSTQRTTSFKDEFQNRFEPRNPNNYQKEEPFKGTVNKEESNVNNEQTKGDKRVCSHCNNANPPRAMYCEQCGQQLTKMCVYCGEENSVNSRFCQKCGKELF